MITKLVAGNIIFTKNEQRKKKTCNATNKKPQKILLQNYKQKTQKMTSGGSDLTSVY